MRGLPWGAVIDSDDEWAFDEKLTLIRDAGFDGIEVAWTPVVPLGKEAIAAAPDYGLECSVVCFPTSGDSFKQILEALEGLNVRHINLQPNVRPLTVLEGIPFILEWMDIARDAGITVFFETHRDRMTTDLRFTLQLIRAIPSLELVGDLSHVLVGQEFAWPVSDEDHALVRELLGRMREFHGRVASREQVQIPFQFPQHRQWLDLFVGWWREGLQLWRDRAPADQDFVFVSELLPPWYAITGADGRELSDRWDDALVLQRTMRDVWASLGDAS